MSDGPEKPSLDAIPAESAGLQSILSEKERQAAEKILEGRSLSSQEAMQIDLEAARDMEALFARYSSCHRRYVPARKG